MQSCARGRRPQKIILPPCLAFVLCLMETSVLGTAPALLLGFKSGGKVFISADLRLCSGTNRLPSESRMDWRGVWVLVPFSLHHFLATGWEEDWEEQEWKAEGLTLLRWGVRRLHTEAQKAEWILTSLIRNGKETISQEQCDNYQ